MKLPNWSSVRFRATVAATVVTAAVLGLASLLIVQLVERDLEGNARSALNNALESASHSVSGEQGEGGETHGESGEGEGGDGASSGDVRQQQITDQSIAEVQAGVDAASQALLFIVPIVVVLLGLAIWFTLGRALRPVRDISNQVSAISGSTLAERVPEPNSGDEIAELAVLMNQMLDRLQRSSDRQRAFVADASHELRSPLSTIAASAEIAKISPDPQKLQKLAGKVGGEAERMQTLITDLLDLARLDEDRQQHKTMSVDLRALSEETVERVDAGNVTIELDAQSVSIDGLDTQLERAVFNLVDNAVAHATGSVRVTVATRAAGAQIVVEDDGPGIPPANRSRVFDRFVRLDQSRQRTTGGAGLGLALVKAIVERHKGTVSIDTSHSLGGAKVTLDLPPNATPRV